MKSVEVRSAILAVIAIAVVASGGCSFRRGPEATAKQFMEAMRRGDEPAARALLTRAARTRMDRPIDFGHGSSMQHTIEPSSMVEDVAIAPVTIHDNGKTDNIRVKMKQDEGEWRIYALGFALAPGGAEITLDMEHPDAIYGELFRRLGEGIGAMFKGMGQGVGAMLKGIGEGVRSANEVSRVR